MAIVVKNPANAGERRDTVSIPGWGNIPGRRKWQPKGKKKKKKEISNIFKKVLIQTLIEIQMIINFYLGL